MLFFNRGDGEGEQLNMIMFFVNGDETYEFDGGRHIKNGEEAEYLHVSLIAEISTLIEAGYTFLGVR